MSVPVLMYHHVAPDREVTPEGFEGQLAWLKKKDFHTLSCAELLAYLNGEAHAPVRPAVITFDDGYADNWVYAFPLLKKYGMKAVIFTPTGKIHNTGKLRPTSQEGGAIRDTRKAEREPEGFLTWEEIRAMCASGLVEIGSHTHTHKDFDSKAGYSDIRDELKRSKSEIVSHTGSWSGALAWPWGEFQEDWLSFLPELGYRMAFTTKAGANSPGCDP
ncbi:MAG: polysaccharide deacetylase family protein, partial [Elusimicrobiota bacterium]